MTTILAFDTSAGACSAAVRSDGGTLAGRYEERARGQAEILMPMVGEVISAAGLAYADLDLIATTVGPGSFTGMRIGIAAARAMSLAARIPVLGLTTLEVVAAGIDGTEAGPHPVLACVESKREDIYAQLFGADGEPKTEPMAATPTALAADLSIDGGLILAGSASKPMAAALEEAGRDFRMADGPAEPQAAVAARMAEKRWTPGVSPAPLAPLYLRPPDTTGPKP